MTGRKDAELIKERYQHEINNAHGRIKKKVDWLYQMNHKLKFAKSEVEKIQKDIGADEEERKKLYSSLQNLLQKETDFEEKMWKTTQKGKKVKSVTIKQKFKDSDIEEARYDSMMDYLHKYPKYTSKSSFSKILDKISYIESGIKKTKKLFHQAISNTKREIEYFPRNIMEAKNIIRTYRKILDEGNEKLSKMRYMKGILFKISSETGKLGGTLDTLNHKLDEKEETVDKIEEEVTEAKIMIKKMGFGEPSSRR